MYRISKEFHFSASHQLDHLPEGHQCARMHGHNYVVIVELEHDELNTDGFVVDYGKLDSFKEFIDEIFEHRHLNEVLDSGLATTAENLAKYFYDLLRNEYYGVGYYWLVSAVTVKETDKTAARYSVD